MCVALFNANQKSSMDPFNKYTVAHCFQFSKQFLVIFLSSKDSYVSFQAKNVLFT